MSLPSFQQLMLPTLAVVCRKLEEMPVSRIEEELTFLLKIPREELQRMVPSGQQSVFANRLNWARCYLTKAGLVEATRRGYVRGTERGRALIAEGLRELDIEALDRFPEFVAWRDRYPTDGPSEACDAPERPEERISSSYEMLQSQLSRELVAKVASMPPEFFERLIVELLCRMGYGGGKLEMGRIAGQERRRRRRRRHQGGRTRPRRRLCSGQALRSGEDACRSARCAISSAGWRAIAPPRACS